LFTYIVPMKVRREIVEKAALPAVTSEAIGNRDWVRGGCERLRLTPLTFVALFEVTTAQILVDFAALDRTGSLIFASFSVGASDARR